MSFRLHTERLNERFRQLLQTPLEFQESLNGVLNYLIDECTLQLVFNERREYKLKQLGLKPKQNDQEKKQKRVKYMCRCDTCFREVNYAVFARHLEACMGLGRRSTRNRSISDTHDPRDLFADEKVKRKNRFKKARRESKKNLKNI